jgi:hypothetical protein
MVKEKNINLKLPIKSALDVLETLESSTSGYGQEFQPERIVRLREVIESLKKELI